MFEAVETRQARSPLLSYCLHLLLAFPVSWLSGFMVESLTNGLYAGNRVLAAFGPVAAVVAGLAGFWFNLGRRDVSAVFVFVPPLLVFIDIWYELRRAWNPSWSKQSRADYVMNNLFGPACSSISSTECLYTLATATVLGGVLYSIGALVGLRLARRHRAQPKVTG